MLMVPNLRAVEPNNLYRKVPTRKPNAEMRTREYLTPAEVGSPPPSWGATANETLR